MGNTEIFNTKVTSISCSGLEDMFDHPTIYLEIDPKEGEIVCPYCSKKFVLISQDQ